MLLDQPDQLNSSLGSQNNLQHTTSALVVDHEQLSPEFKARRKVNRKRVNDDEVFLDDDEEDRIDWRKLKEYLQETRPQKVDKSEYTVKDVYKFKTGNNYCGKSTETSDIDGFGIGITIYFRFMKTLACYFMIFAILAIPSLYFCIQSQMNAFDSGKDYYDGSYLTLLSATSVGAVGLDSYDCQDFYAGEILGVNTRNMTVSCPTGFISSNNFIYGLADQVSTCYFLSPASVDTSCNNLNSTNLIKQQQKCLGKPSCNFVIDQSFFNTDCNINTASSVVFRFYCERSYLSMGNDVYLEKRYIALVMGLIDALIIALYIFMIIQLGFSDRATKRHVLKHSLNPSLYSIEIENLPDDIEPERMKLLLKDYFEKLPGREGLDDSTDSHLPTREVIDVQLVESHKVLELLVKRFDVRSKRDELVRKFVSKYDLERLHFTTSTVKIGDLAVFLTNFNEEFELGVRARRYVRKIMKKVKKINQLNVQIAEARRENEQKVFGAFVTYDSMVTRNEVLASFEKAPAKEFLMRKFNMFGTEDDYFNGKRLKLLPAPDPAQIRWHNWDVKHPVLRRSISYLVSLILLIASFSIVVLIKVEQEKYAATATTIICEKGYKANSTMAARVVSSVSTDGTMNNADLECFCRKLLADGTNLVSYEFPNGSTYCGNWLTAKTVSILLPLGMVLSIVIINVLCQLVFKLLGKLEAHKNYGAQTFSRLIKLFVIEFLNTALVLLIVNANFGGGSAIFSGTYSDFSPYWYRTVGATLLSAVILNVLSMPFVEMGGVLWSKLLHCWDRKCRWRDSQVTRKKRQRDLQNLYLGPEFQVETRYANILTILSVCMLYSSGLPLFYLVCSLYIGVTYWIDKYFLLRLYRIPENTDEYLQNLVRHLMYIPLLLHTLFAIWVYGNNDIFEEEMFTSVADYTTTKFQAWGMDLAGESNYVMSFFNRVQYSQNIILIIIFFLVVVLFLSRWVLREVFINIFGICCNQLYKKRMHRLSAEIQDISFHKLLRERNLIMEKKVLNKEIKEARDTDYIQFLESKLAKIELTLKERRSEVPVFPFVPYRFRHAFSYNLKNNMDFHEIYLHEYQVDPNATPKPAIKVYSTMKSDI